MVRQTKQKKNMRYGPDIILGKFLRRLHIYRGASVALGFGEVSQADDRSTRVIQCCRTSPPSLHPGPQGPAQARTPWGINSTARLETGGH